MHSAENVACAHLLTDVYAVYPYGALSGVAGVVLIAVCYGYVVVFISVECECVFLHDVRDLALLPFNVGILIVGIDASHAYQSRLRAIGVTHCCDSHGYFSRSRFRLSYVYG